MGEPIEHVVSAIPWINGINEVGLFFNGFHICRGCGVAVAPLQDAMRAHIMTCEPLRRS